MEIHCVYETVYLQGNSHVDARALMIGEHQIDRLAIIRAPGKYCQRLQQLLTLLLLLRP